MSASVFNTSRNKGIVLLIAALAVAAVCIFAVNSDDSSSENTIYWEDDETGLAYSAVENSGVAEVSCVSVNTTGDIVIPETVTYDGVTYTVTKVADYGFAYCWHIDSVEIPETVTEIGKLAFAGMTYEDSYDSSLNDGVTTFTFAGTSNVKIIGDGAFKSTVTAFSNEALTIPASVETIGEYAFAYQSGRDSSNDNLKGPTSVVFEGAEDGSSHLKSIGSYAFFEDYFLSGDIVIPASVESIGDYVFHNNYGDSTISSLVFVGADTGDSVLESIGDNAFNFTQAADGSSISLTIPATVKTIGDNAFTLTSETSTWASGVVFAGAEEGTSSLESIGDNAFVSSACTSLVIPGSVRTMGSSFANCTSLTEVTFKVQNGAVALESLEGTFSGCTSLTTVTFGATPASLSLNKTFSGCSSLQTLALDGVVEIGDFAFYNCDSLTSIAIPASVTIIGDHAFNNCDQLATATVSDEDSDPSGLTSIGERAFYNCNLLTSFDMPNALTSIGDEAFYGCSSLSSIAISDSVTTIGNRAFSSCTSLSSLTLSNSVTSIGNNAFYNCDNLLDVAIPASVKTIGDYAFSHCSGVSSVTFQDGLETIGLQAFSSDSSLTSVSIPSTVTSIGNYAFSSCSSLQTADLSSASGITYLDNTVFSSCYSLTNIIISDTVTDFGASAMNQLGLVSGSSVTTRSDSNYTAVYNRNGSILLGLSHRETLTASDVTAILQGVTEVGAYAFYDADYASGTVLTIPSEITRIGANAFATDTVNTSVFYFTEVTFEDRDDSIAISRQAFPYHISGSLSYALTNVPTIVEDTSDSAADATTYPMFSYVSSITFADGVESIPDYFVTGTFDSVEIPATVKSIGVQAFRGSLTTVTFSGDSQLETIGDSAFSNCDSLTTMGSIDGVITIPSHVTKIGDYAFYDCAAITSVVLNDELAEIGDYAFNNCNNLVSVQFGTSSSLSTLGSGAFQGCYALTEISIPAGVTEIADLTFSGCSGLTSVTMGSLPSVIGEKAFNGCSALTGISCTGQGTLGSIGERAFNGCSALVKLFSSDSGTFSLSGATSLGDYCFYGCTGLNTVEFSDSGTLTKIGSHAFEGSGLKSISIPEGVTEIGASAFDSCSSLTSVNVPASLVTWEKTQYGSLFYNTLNIETLIFADGSNLVITYSDGLHNDSEDISEYDEISSFPQPEAITYMTVANTLFGAETENFTFDLKELAVPYTYMGNFILAGCPSLEKLTLVGSANPQETECRQFGFSGVTGVSFSDESGCGAVANLITHTEWKGMSVYNTGDAITTSATSTSTSTASNTKPGPTSTPESSSRTGATPSPTSCRRARPSPPSMRTTQTGSASATTAGALLLLPSPKIMTS
jgi:hypothetical protein